MPKLIYQDEPDPPKPRKPRRKKYPRGKYPRQLTHESRDVKLMRLPYQQFITLSGAAEIMEIGRPTLQRHYLYSQTYALPDFIEIIRDANRIVGLKRIGP